MIVIVIVPGTDAAVLIVPDPARPLARSLRAVLDQRKLLEKRIQELLDERPLSKILTSLSGIGMRTGAPGPDRRRRCERVPTATHFVSCAGPPATRSSRSSIRSEQPSHRDNKQLIRAFFLAAFAALSDPASRAY
ncbi:transposase [Streptomyces sp. NPDC058695]|uniref:transposase n=1 Tax=Streptomyces sp. NPDC058695 TaxID=3346604 RepID=UPI003650709B